MDAARDRVNQLIERNTKIILVLFAVSVIACLLQSAGYATPGWLIMELAEDNTTFTFNMGIWYIVVCQNGSCENQPGTMLVIESLWSQEDKKDFKRYQLMATIAVVFSIAAAGSLIVYLRRIRLQLDIISPASLAVFSCLISGILTLVTVGTFSDDVNTEYDIWKQTEGEDIKLLMPYSLLLLGLGGALCCLVFIGLCVQIYVQYKATSCGSEAREEWVGMASDKQP